MRDLKDEQESVAVAHAEQITHAFDQGQEAPSTKNQEVLLSIVDSFFDVATASSSIKTLNFLISCITNPDDSIYYQLEGDTISNSISTVNSLSELIVELQEAHLTNQYERLLSCIDEFFNLGRASDYTKTLNLLLTCIADMDEQLSEDFGERTISNARSKINVLSTFLIELQEKNSRLLAAR